MSTIQTYHMPANGLGTNFAEFDRPINFAATYTNRFRNTTGGAERRPGLGVYASAHVTGNPNLTRMHEYVDIHGNETLFSSDDFGNIYRLNASAWSTVLTGKSQFRILSAEANGKLIFCNGVDRNFYTDDAGNSFKELKAFITIGVLAAGSNTVTVVDGNVSNWIGNTLASNNDIVYNVTRNAYGIVTAIASASLTITNIGTSATGAGFCSVNQSNGDSYQLIDYVPVSAVPADAGGNTNIAVAGTGTNTITIAVSGVNFTSSELRTNDIIYNTTRSAISLISSVSANISLNQAIAGQVSGDSLVFLKSAMPIASWIHVHYGRCYYLDSRNNSRVVISAPDDPQDVTTYQNTLNATSYNFGTQQPSGDTIISMGTFLSYFVASGKKNLYIYQGNTPIADTGGTAINFTPIAYYPNGVASRFGISTDGTNLLHITVDGLQSVSLVNNPYSLNQNNASVPIFNTLKKAINSVSNTDNIQLTYYPRRRWLINKVGDQCYILNTNPSYGSDGVQQNIQSWHLFDGAWAQLNHYFVRRNGDLIGCGTNGSVYYLDNGNVNDVGTSISTDLVTAWLRLEEPEVTPRIKEGHFIRPIFESSGDISYTINARAGLDNFSSDSIIASAAALGTIGQAIIGQTAIGVGEFAETTKYPLRWRGEQVRIEFISQSNAATDVISAFTLYGNIGGVR